MGTPPLAGGDPVALCARGEAAWHAAAYAGLGVPWQDDGSIAWGARVPHPFLLAGISLVPEPQLPAGLADGVFSDSWAAMDGRLPSGWRAKPFDPWMLRPPGPAAGPAVPGLVVENTEDALRFERIAFLGASGRLPDVPGQLHPPGSASFPGLRLLLAVLDGRDVGGAIAVEHDTGVVVSGVAVVAEARRRGVGAALTAAACAAAPDKPATLCASDLGLGVYRRLGFVEVGRPLHWFPPTHPHYPAAGTETRGS